MVAVPLSLLMGSRCTVQGVMFCPTEDIRQAASYALSVDEMGPSKTRGQGYENLWGLLAYVRPGSQIVWPCCNCVDYEGAAARQSGGSATYVELMDSVSAVDQRTSPTRLILASRSGDG